MYLLVSHDDYGYSIKLIKKQFSTVVLRISCSEKFVKIIRKALVITKTDFILDVFLEVFRHFSKAILDNTCGSCFKDILTSSN